MYRGPNRRRVGVESKGEHCMRVGREMRELREAMRLAQTRGESVKGLSASIRRGRHRKAGGGDGSYYTPNYGFRR